MFDLNDVEKQIKFDESSVPNLRSNIEKKIIWAEKSSQRTPLSIVFIHGFQRLVLK